jgi:hypothetical protein
MLKVFGTTKAAWFVKVRPMAGIGQPNLFCYALWAIALTLNFVNRIGYFGVRNQA